MSAVKFLANLIFKKQIQKQKGIMKILPGDKVKAEEKAKYAIKKLQERANINTDKLTKSDLEFLAEDIVNPLKTAQKTVVKSADVIPFRFKRSFAEELADAGKKGDFTRMSGIMKLDPKFKEVIKAFKKSKADEKAYEKMVGPKKLIPDRDVIPYQSPEVQKLNFAEKLKRAGLTEKEYMDNIVKRGYGVDDVIYARDFYGDTTEKIFERAAEKGTPVAFADGGRIGYAEGNGVYDEDVAKKKFGERVRKLMDEGYDFGEAVKEAMKEEGFADGGVAGLLGERPGYANGNTVLNNALAAASVPYNFGKGIIGNVSNPGAVTQVSLTQGQRNRLNEIAQAKGTPTGTIDYSDYGSPTKTFSGIRNMTPLDASLAITIGGTGFSINPNGSVNYTGGAYDFNKGNVITDFIDQGGIIGAANKLGGKIYDTVNPPEEDNEYDFSDIERQTAMLNPFAFIGLIKSGTTGKGIAKTLLKNKIQKEVGKKIVRPKIIKKLKKLSGVEFEGTGKFKNIPTSTKDYGPYKKSTPTPKKKYTPPSRPHGNGGGGSGRPDNPGGFTNPGKNSYGPHMASGGIARQNFAMGRRAFMKLLGGAAAGIGALKTGAFKLLGKETAPIAKEVVKDVATGSGTPPPYFFKLVEKIKTLGDDTLPTRDKVIAKKYKDYVMEEDFAGNIEIIKKGGDDMFPEDVYISYKVDEVPIKRGGKRKSTKVEEYEEYTARPDQEGKMKDVEPGVPDEVVEEGTMFEDNITDFGKASGGIARMLGE